MTLPDRVVFDAEPLIAHADDEPGAATVEQYLDAVDEATVDGFVGCVTLAEVRYVLARKYDRTVASEYLDWIEELGVTPTDVDDCWVAASEFVLEYNPALGDAIALASAERLGATLLVGADDDYDEVTDVPVRRFRDEPA